MSLTPEEREEALSALGEKWGVEISNIFRDLYAAIETSRESEYRLVKALRHIRWWVINGNTPVLARLGMIEQTVLQALGDRLYEENGAD